MRPVKATKISSTSSPRMLFTGYRQMLSTLPNIAPSFPALMTGAGRPGAPVYTICRRSTGMKRDKAG